MAKGKSKTTVAEPKGDDKWRAESDHRTLREAEEIKADKGRLGAAAAHAKTQMEANAKVAGLHKRGLISDKALSKLKGLAGGQVPQAAPAVQAPVPDEPPSAGGVMGGPTQ